MRDRINQSVVGLFIGNFVYALLVLRTVRAEASDANQFIPYLSVNVSLLFALGGLGFLIYYFHHLALSIQAPQVAADVAHSLLVTIKRELPPAEEVEGERPLSDDELHDLEERFRQGGARLRAQQSGYLQRIDSDRLMRAATGADFCIELLVRPGEFLHEHHEYARVLPPDRLDGKWEKRIRDAFLIRQQRSLGQDVELALQQLVDVALRALSPSVHDPFTAITCIEWLQEACAEIGRRGQTPRARRDEEGRVRLLAAPPLSLEQAVSASFGMVRRSAGRHANVWLRLLESIASLLETVRPPEQRRALYAEALALVRGVETQVSDPEDRRRIVERFRRISVDLSRIEPQPVEARS
jgi:uncharacterized membrane protein